ncbi:hypothetical protein CPLU01_02427 [Colletotrichum plurivorum]|uniref:Uncharacterized protein n=1 Tax=Colletotrichum plurivorum TaxID=2175906 RepID=A0A8H6KWN8_9PEZI|nr:hypothetical protein CPLU01_02427 [Colletotrichum plurivorum]
MLEAFDVVSRGAVFRVTFMVRKHDAAAPRHHLSASLIKSSFKPILALPLFLQVTTPLCRPALARSLEAYDSLAVKMSETPAPRSTPSVQAGEKLQQRRGSDDDVDKQCTDQDIGANDMQKDENFSDSGYGSYSSTVSEGVSNVGSQGNSSQCGENRPRLLLFDLKGRWPVKKQLRVIDMPIPQSAKDKFVDWRILHFFDGETSFSRSSEDSDDEEWEDDIDIDFGPELAMSHEKTASGKPALEWTAINSLTTQELQFIGTREPVELARIGDWALIDVEGTDFMCSNAIPTKSQHDPWRLIETYEEDCSLGDLEVVTVVVITSHGVLEGSLRRGGSAMILGVGPAVSRMHDLKILNGELLPGDSGAWVVDAEKGKLYGHVIAVDVLGEVYVLPIADTFRQIRGVFAADVVSLPTSSEVVECRIKWRSEISMASLQTSAMYQHLPGEDVGSVGSSQPCDANTIAIAKQTKPTVPAPSLIRKEGKGRHQRHSAVGQEIITLVISPDAFGFGSEKPERTTYRQRIRRRAPETLAPWDDASSDASKSMGDDVFSDYSKASSQSSWGGSRSWGAYSSSRSQKSVVKPAPPRSGPVPVRTSTVERSRVQGKDLILTVPWENLNGGREPQGSPLPAKAFGVTIKISGSAVIKAGMIEYSLSDGSEINIRREDADPLQQKQSAQLPDPVKALNFSGEDTETAIRISGSAQMRVGPDEVEISDGDDIQITGLRRIEIRRAAAPRVENEGLDAVLARRQVGPKGRLGGGDGGQENKACLSI